MQLEFELAKKKVILLFFRDYEYDKYVFGDRYAKRIVRPIYNLLHRRQKITGFQMSFNMMVKSLQDYGYKPLINKYQLARRAPDYPVGIVGSVQFLDQWKLNNPALLGPSLYDHPGLKPDLFSDTRFKKYIVLADWMKDIFLPAYGDKCVSWFAGIDVERFPLTKGRSDLTMLIYNKIRWDHEFYNKNMLRPIRLALANHGLKTFEIKYNYYDRDDYLRKLSSASGMIFICEHETQGIAYQEALACDVPVLAWDRGYWADPLWKQFHQKPPSASSVPFFSEDCGMTFSDIDSFHETLKIFLQQMPRFTPRQFVSKNLSPTNSAKLYSDVYFSLMS